MRLLQRSASAINGAPMCHDAVQTVCQRLGACLTALRRYAGPLGQAEAVSRRTGVTPLCPSAAE